MSGTRRHGTKKASSGHLRGWIGLLRESVAAWSEHKGPQMGAALSYYTAFALAPVITLVLSVASLAIKREVASRALVEQCSALIGVQGGRVVQEILDHAGTLHALSWSTAVSVLVLLVSASGAFGELQDSLNQIWEVPPRKHKWTALLKERLLSFSMVFILGFFMLTSLILSTGIAAFSRTLAGAMPPWLLEIANTGVSFLFIAALFAAIFVMLPDLKLKWGDVLPGAVFSASLFIVGKFLLGLYIAHSSFASSYGAAGSFVVILVWVFYSAQILYFEAEVTRSYTLRRRGRGAGPGGLAP